MEPTERDRAILKALVNWDPPADIVLARVVWERHAEPYNHSLPAIGALHENVSLGSGLRADIAVPAGPPPFPVVLYLHGGGWSFGSPRSFRKVGMSFAAAGFLAVNLDYRLAPEHPFPAALDDVQGAIDWTGRGAVSYGADGGRLAIGGDSAGANLALATAIRAPLEIRQRLSSLLLLYGAYDLQGVLDRANHHPGLVHQVRTYLGTRYPAALSDPLASPLFASLPKSLPPCFLLEGSDDSFVGGESQAMAAAMQRADVPHELHIIGGMPHGFVQIFELDGCQTGWRLMLDFLRRQTRVSVPA